MQHVESNLLQTQLQTGCDVALAIGKRRTRCAWWPKSLRKTTRVDAADNRRATVPGHFDTFRMMPEVVEVQPKLPILFRAHDLAKLVDESRAPVRREAHHRSEEHTSELQSR